MADPTLLDAATQRPSLRERYRGCLIGGAVGDALGAPVEFLKLAEIRARFGKAGITDFAPAYGSRGNITDDTQMTLFTAEGLLRGWVRGSMKGITSYQATTGRAYLRWLITQGGHPVLDQEGPVKETGWLITHRQLHHRRAPGRTCLAALEAMRRAYSPATNSSKGCGGVMRMAPVGLFGRRAHLRADPESVFKMGSELSALTHGHPTGSLAGGAFAVIIYALAWDLSLGDAVAIAEDCLKQAAKHEEVLERLAMARDLARSTVARNEAIGRLGQGWVADEALGIAVYAALVASDFVDGVVLAANHDGDSDSTASMAGNILGLIHGEAAIPARWMNTLELGPVIAEIADDLHDYVTWNIGEYIDNPVEEARIRAKYPAF